MMSIHQFLKLMSFAIVSLLCSCRQSNDSVAEVHSDSRDKVTTVTLNSIDDDLPPIHSDARFYISGDTLYINDYKSTYLQFIAYDLNNAKYIGAFGKYGLGPGEIANFGSLFFDRHRGIMYGMNLAKWEIDGFDIKEALADSSYKAFVKVKLTENDERPINHATYVNDTTIYCAVYVPEEHGMQLSSHVGKFNLLSGKSEILDSVAEPGRHTGVIEVMPSQNRIFEIGITHDRIRIYNLDGNLIKTVYGPDFKEKHDRRTYYFASTALAGDKLLAVYSGKDARHKDADREIVVMDLDGNYIKTLDIGARIASIAYYDKTDRVYVSQYGEPQFGYFNLSEVLGDSASTKAGLSGKEEAADDTEKEQSTPATVTVSSSKGVEIIYSSDEAAKAPKYDSSKKNDGPFSLIDPLISSSMAAVGITDIGGWKFSEDDDMKRYSVSIKNLSSDTVAIESIKLPDARFEVEWNGVVKYIPGLLSGFNLKTKEDVRLDDYRFILTYKGGKYPPQTFHINLHPDINKLRADRINGANQ